MRIARIGELAALAAAASLASYVVFSRGKLAADVYAAEGAAYAEDAAEHAKCTSDHEYLHLAPVKCVRAQLAVQRWWRWHVAARVWDKTYLCIDHPCADVLHGVFDSWIALAALTALLVAVFVVGFDRVFARLDRGERVFGRGHAAMNPHIQDAVFAEGGPAVMIGSAAPYTIAPPSLRSRFATWGRTRELI